jgi:8-oxo-dGTP pyrophosphatase MutT (NUDIX family)
MKAAVLVTYNEDNKVLGVTRGLDSVLYGLPGGKIDIGESAETAIIRETLEETGMTAFNLIEVYQAVDCDGWDVHVFLGDVAGMMEGSDEGLPAWVTWEDLFEGPFGKFNRELYEFLNSSESRM